jgi:hypothetical protein
MVCQAQSRKWIVQMDNKSKWKVTGHIVAAPIITNINYSAAAMGACGGGFFVVLVSLALAFVVATSAPSTNRHRAWCFIWHFPRGRQALSNIGNAINDLHAARLETGSENASTRARTDPFATK